jgi:hypothetical protein
MELSICREIARQNRGALSLHGTDGGIIIRLEFHVED